jgi:hypothetical protein
MHTVAFRRVGVGVEVGDPASEEQHPATVPLINETHSSDGSEHEERGPRVPFFGRWGWKGV